MDIGSLVVKIVGDNSRFDRMLKGSESRLSKFAYSATRLGRSLSVAVTAPLLGIGFAAVKSARGVEAANFRRSVNLLTRDLNRLGRDVGRILIPPIVTLINWVRIGVKWFRGLSQEQKKWVVIILAAVAAVGPLLLILGSLIPVISALISGFVGMFTVILPAAFAFGLLALKATLFIAAGAAVVLGLALVVDAFLEMTGVVNLGLNSFVSNFRVAGHKITTWLTAAWLQIFKGWNFLYKNILALLEEIVFAFNNAGSFIYKNWLKWQYEMHLITDDELIKKTQEALVEREQLFADHYGKLTTITRDYEKSQMDMNKTIADLFKEDVADKTGAKGLIPDLLKKVPGLVEKLKSLLPDFGNLFNMPKLNDKMPSRIATRDFEQMSLKRFALDTVQAKAEFRMQRVTDVGVQSSVRELTEVTKTGFAKLADTSTKIAILG